MVFTRMLYSCLVDADFLDTEEFMAGSPVPRGGGESMEILEQKLQAHIFGWFPPIYVVPYTSIIEQNAQVFRDILGAENVLEHHSGVLYDMENEADPAQIRLAKATENWDMPVVVTTAVQFFESLYACRSSKCRKLHNLANSVIIFDEAQMLPLPYLRPCVYAIAQLVKHYSVSAVLCTATQPAWTTAPSRRSSTPCLKSFALSTSARPLRRSSTFWTTTELSTCPPLCTPPTARPYWKRSKSG